MVWWMHFNPSRRREGVFFGLETEKDMVYQTINIMYDCHNENYDEYDIRSLTNVGVNIFNVDMTKHDVDFFEHIKKAMKFAHEIPEMMPSSYYTPVAMSVTMSANEPVDVDERVDIIILKDIMKTDQLRDFKKRNKKFSSLPILFWPSTLKIEDLNELIKISDGIVVDPTLCNIFYGFRHLLRRCKEARKPVFFMSPSLIEDYYTETGNDRQLLIQVHDLLKSRLDGLFLVDHGNEPPVKMIQSLIRATEVIERDFHDTETEYLTLSTSLEAPVLPPYVTALAASLAALKCGAEAIIVLTTTGSSAKILSCASPPCHVIAITRYEKIARKMHLYRKVMPLQYRGAFITSRAGSWQDESLARIAFGTQFGLDIGLYNVTAKLVVLAPSAEGEMYCNSFYIDTVGTVINTFKCGLPNPC